MANSNKPSIFVFGASGHAKVVIDVIEREGLSIIASIFDDDVSLKGGQFFGYPVLGGKDSLIVMNRSINRGIIAIGNNRIRRNISKWLLEKNFQLVSSTHPSAQLGRDIIIGDGTVLMASVVVNSGSRIGQNVIVNTLASVDHDCVIGDNVHIAPGVRLCGNVHIGENSIVGAGSIIVPNIVIGNNVTVGAGSTVLRDIPDGKTVVGSPAKSIVK